ncbi:MAG: HEAT repeat domain-containing protein [Myxococcota bacterium]
MALFGLIGGDKPTPKNIDKQVARVKERYSQPEYRRTAMERLLSWGTPEAIEGLLARFTVVVQSPHWDEEEKRWLVEELVEKGPVAKEALVRFLSRENHIAFAAQALRQLTAADEYVALLAKALGARSPDDYRSAQGKQELVACLAEAGASTAGEFLVPYLDDHADDVQCATIDAVEALRAEPGFERLRRMVTEEAHSARVLRHAAGAMSRLEIHVDPTSALAAAVVEDYVVRDGKLARATDG